MTLETDVDLTKKFKDVICLNYKFDERLTSLFYVGTTQQNTVPGDSTNMLRFTECFPKKTPLVGKSILFSDTILFICLFPNDIW